MSDLIFVKCKNCPLFYLKEFKEYLEILEGGREFTCKHCIVDNLE